MNKYAGKERRYEKNKTASLDEQCHCPCCGEIFLKENKQQCFCDSACQKVYFMMIEVNNAYIAIRQKKESKKRLLRESIMRSQAKNFGLYRKRMQSYGLSGETLISDYKFGRSNGCLACFFEDYNIKTLSELKEVIILVGKSTVMKYRNVGEYAWREIENAIMIV